MSPWSLVELSKVAEVSSGDGAPQEAAAFGESGTPFIRAGSLVPLLDGAPESQLELIPEAESLQRRMRTYPAHTIVFAKSGMSCTKGLVYELEGSAHVVNHLAALECGSDLYPRFLLRWFQINSPARLIANPSYPSIRISDIRSERIPLPPLAEQKRIAGILDAADALRTKRRECLAQLDTLLQSTFLDMFGDPVTNQKGWEVMDFESIGASRLGKMLDKGKEVGDCQFPYLANTNVQWGRFDLTDLRTMDFSEADRNEFELQNGDLLICEGGEVGRTAIWRGEREDVFFQKALHRVRLLPKLAVPEYVYYFIWFMARNGGFLTLTNSATIAHLTGVKLKRLPFPRPPLDLQHRFAAIVDSVEQQRARQQAHLAELDALFASLQSRAFRGDL